MSSLGQLVIELAANTARLQSDMGKAVGIAERGAANMKKAFSFVTTGVGGGLIGTFLIGAAKNAIKFGDDLQKAATKAGIGGKAISELAYAAKLADVDLASLSTAIKKMQVALSQAKEGAKGPTESLAALGLTIADIQALNPDRQFELLADRISKLTDPADRARAATELFGKAGADLLPLFEKGAAGIRQAREEAEKLGLSFSDETLKKMADTDDAIKKLSASWDGFAVVLTEKVAPALTKVLDGMSSGKTWQTMKDFGKSPLFFLLDKATEEDPRRFPGRRNGDTSIGPLAPAPPPGYGSNLGAEEAKKAAKAAADEYEAFSSTMRQGQFDLIRSGNEWLRADGEQQIKVADNAREQSEEYVASWRAAYGAIEAEAEKMSVPAQIFRDAFLNAFDDMVNTGKIKFDELFKYILAEFARRSIANLFDSMFSGSGKGSGGGWLGTAASWVGTLFGAPKANGGAVQAGKSYVVGERGREILTMGGNGYVTPNHQLGGGGAPVSIQISQSYHGTSEEIIRAQDRRTREITRAIFDELDRRGVMRAA